MPKMAEFHSIYEASKPTGNRVYHDNSACAPGRGIPPDELRAGSGGYRLCRECQQLNSDNKQDDIGVVVQESHSEVQPPHATGFDSI